jgi:AcrR family transcriptional regulator
LGTVNRIEGVAMAGRPRDEQARATILRRAADLASVDGLDGLTIGRLAADLGVSKSGLFGYFGSKEELQLATIRTATGVFVGEVVEPALAVPAGLGRVWALCANWLAYSQRRVFPGGCFFSAGTAEFDARPGRVRDALAAAHTDWTRLVTRTLQDARDLGEFAADTDPGQLAFELIAFMESANAAAVLHDDPTVYGRSRTAIRRRLADSATDPSVLPPDA